MTNQKKTSANYATEMRERAVRMVFDNAKDYPSQAAAIKSIAAKFGCAKSTLRRWGHDAEAGQVVKPPPTSEERARIEELEREVRKLRQANEILRKASAYFAQAELDRRSKI